MLNDIWSPTIIILCLFRRSPQAESLSLSLSPNLMHFLSSQMNFILNVLNVLSTRVSHPMRMNQTKCFLREKDYNRTISHVLIPYRWDFCSHSMYIPIPMWLHLKNSSNAILQTFFGSLTHSKKKKLNNNSVEGWRLYRGKYYGVVSIVWLRGGVSIEMLFTVQSKLESSWFYGKIQLCNVSSGINKMLEALEPTAPFLILSL